MASTPLNPTGERYCIPSEKQMLERVALFQRATQGTSDAADFTETETTGLVPALPVIDTVNGLFNDVLDFNLQDFTGNVAPNAVPPKPFNLAQLDFSTLFQNSFGHATQPLPISDGIQPLVLPTDRMTIPNWADMLFSISSGYTGGSSPFINPAAIGGELSTDGTSLDATPSVLNSWLDPTLSATTNFSTELIQHSLPHGSLTLFSPTRKLHLMHQALLAKSATPLKPGTSEFEKLFKEALEYAKNKPIYEDKKIAYLYFYVFNPAAMKIPQKVKIRPAIARDLYFQCYGRHDGTIDAWRKMKAANSNEYQEWMERAGNLSEEILEQIKRGYIYGDTRLKMGSARSLPRSRD